MTTDRTQEYLAGLVKECCKLPRETEWVEFKENNGFPQEIGEYISALSNASALHGKAFAYLIWGVRDEDHAIVGTAFDPGTVKVGNEELENWLLRQLNPKIHFRFFRVVIDALPVVLLEIQRVSRQPVQFQSHEWIRVGSYKKKLKDFPEKQRELWRIFDQLPFEQGVAAERVSDPEVLQFLDYPAYFELLKLPLPDNRSGILEALDRDAMIQRCEAGGWNITNLGAILFAKKLKDFRSLSRRTVRVIQYKDSSRVDTLKEQEGGKGYASAFSGLIAYIRGLLPANEVIERSLRRTVPVFPELSLRELIANALIHQDFFMTGSNPMVEIFPDRIEITNPGLPLVHVDRFVDSPPRSRNESLASFMRRIGICEERGSGWDKVVAYAELYQLPAPLSETIENCTRITLFAPKPLNKLDKVDRIRAVYLHACLKYVNREPITNSSIRQRFGIDEKNAAMASRLLSEALEANVIVIRDPEAGTRNRTYLPFWAATG